MFRAIKISRFTPCFLWPLSTEHNKYDVGKDVIKPVGETGMDRLKLMFKRDEFQEVSVELNTVLQSTTVGGFIGAIMGGTVRSREAYLYFIESNHATAFKSTMDAKKQLQNYVTLAFMRGAYHWGWRLALFSGTFSLIFTSMSVYRGEPSILDYFVGGTVTGALFRCNLGLAATLVGAGLGAVLSTVFGGFVMLSLKLTGISIDDIRKALYKLRDARKQQFDEAMEKSATIKNDDLTRNHDQLVAAAGKKTIADL